MLVRGDAALFIKDDLEGLDSLEGDYTTEYITFYRGLSSGLFFFTNLRKNLSKIHQRQLRRSGFTSLQDYVNDIFLIITI